MAVILNVEVELSGVDLPVRFKSDLVNIFRAHANQIQAKGRVSRKPLSIKTQRSRIQSVSRIFRELREDGYMLTSPYSLKEKHIAHLVERWIAAEKATGTIENELSYLRAFCEWVGKFGIVKSLRDYPSALNRRRVYIAECDKSWEAKGIDIEKTIAEIEQTDIHVAMAMRLQAAFGLRRKESSMLRPGRIKEGDLYLPVLEGTKGGRPRQIRIDFDWQHQLLSRAAKIAHPKYGSLIPPGFTVEQWERRYFYVMEKHNVTSKGLGVTSHGLRHGFAHELYQRLSGVPAAVKNSLQRPDNNSHKEAIGIIVETLGHSRVTKSGAYLSSFTYKKPIPLPSFEAVIDAVKSAGGNISKAATALSISRQSLYRVLDKNKAK